MMMAGGEIQLPEPIIQRLQYFLNSKEAARTTILSKSWGSAWLTRPNLVFDQRDFDGSKPWGSAWPTRPNPVFDQWDFDDADISDPFSKFADETLKRYEDSNLKIESFRLLFQHYWRCGRGGIVNMIVRALNLGPTRLDITSPNSNFVLPKEVFASENLVELTLNPCELDLGPNDVRCSKLRSLSLQGLWIGRPIMLFDIISSCPLLEKLSLSRIFNPSGGGDLIADGVKVVVVLPRLTSLVLVKVKYDTFFLSNISSNFPCLKDLTLEMYYAYKEGQVDREVLIASPSLELLHLKIYREDSWRFKFDVPSIRLFTYEGTFISSLSFISTSSGWRSDVVIRHEACLSTSWFRSLSQLLTTLGRSRIYIHLRVHTMLSFDYKVGGIEGVTTQQMIEELTIDVEKLPSLTCYAFLDALFLMCCPKYVILQNNIEFIGHTILQAMEVKYSTPNQFMYGLRDLKAASAWFFDEGVSQWRNVPLEAFSDELTILAEEKRIVGFTLEWQS